MQWIQLQNWFMHSFWVRLKFGSRGHELELGAYSQKSYNQLPQNNVGIVEIWDLRPDDVGIVEIWDLPPDDVGIVVWWDLPPDDVGIVEW